MVKLARLILATGAAVAFGGLAFAQITGGFERSAFQPGTGGLAGTQSGSLNSVAMVFGPAGGWAREAPARGMCSTRYYRLPEAGCLRENRLRIGDMLANPNSTATPYSFTNICPHAVRFRSDHYGVNRFTEARLMMGFAAYDFYPGDTRIVYLKIGTDARYNDKYGITRCSAPPRPAAESIGAGTWVGKACATVRGSYKCEGWRFVFTANGGFSQLAMNGRAELSASGRWRQDGENISVSMANGATFQLKLRGGVLTGTNYGRGIAGATWEMRRQ